MINAPNIIRFNIQIKTQRKILIILLFSTMVLTILYFIAFHFSNHFKAKTLDEKFKAAMEILDEICVTIVLECLALYFVIKLDHIGILIFAFVEVTYLALLVVTFIFLIVIQIKEPTAHTTDESESRLAAFTRTEIIIIVIDFITLILSISKIVFMFKLTKNLKEQTRQDTQQQYPLI